MNALRCRRKFLRFFPKGFADETYLSWERDYKWETHERWQDALSREEFSRLLRSRQFSEVAARAVRVEATVISAQTEGDFSSLAYATRIEQLAPGGAVKWSVNGPPPSKLVFPER